MKKTILTLAISFASLNYVNAQINDTSIEGINFSKYPAKVENSKAKLNLASHSLGKTYKTAISEQYKSEPINFGGHYVMTFWGAGMGMTQGAMVDAKTGKTQGTIYYYDGNKVVALSHEDQLKIIRQIYKETTGKDLKQYSWRTDAPWYVRFMQAINQKTVEVAWK